MSSVLYLRIGEGGAALGKGHGARKKAFITDISAQRKPRGEFPKKTHNPFIVETAAATSYK